MSFLLTVVVILSHSGASVAQFYGSLSGYACSQPALSDQCQCQSFCGAYNSYDGYADTADYPTSPRQHKRRRNHKRKKLRFETVENSDFEKFSLPPTSTSSPRSSTHPWEDEDQWSKKFVNSRMRAKTSEGISEEFPEINSAEISAAKARMRVKAEEADLWQSSAAAARPAPSRSGGVGVGSSVGVGPIDVSSGLGIGAPGIGGLGGGGGIFGITSGAGVGVPGVGPIGISSGLGIGR